MSTIREGAFEWEFEAGWEPSKYDDWSYYRKQFCSLANSKAVDIVAIDPNGALWLIEAKDFTSGNRNEEKVPLHDEMAAKVRDSLAGLLAAVCRSNDANEERFAKRARQAAAIRVVLHVEQARIPAKIFAAHSILPTCSTNCSDSAGAWTRRQLSATRRRSGPGGRSNGCRTPTSQAASTMIAPRARKARPCRAAVTSPPVHRWAIATVANAVARGMLITIAHRSTTGSVRG